MSATALRIVEGSSMDKTKALSAALSQIERQFGKGSVMKLGKNDRSMDIETISSGSLGLDIALGVGGLPRGRVVEIYGAESSGKTTLALHTVAEGQKKGGICAFIDAEHALDPVYARKLGVNIDELLISQPRRRATPPPAAAPATPGHQPASGDDDAAQGRPTDVGKSLQTKYSTHSCTQQSDHASVTWIPLQTTDPKDKLEGRVMSKSLCSTDLPQHTQLDEQALHKPHKSTSKHIDMSSNKST